jgi:dehydrogenase/reductase SDR family member 7B
LVEQFAVLGSKIVLSSRRKEVLELLVTKLKLTQDSYLILPLDLEKNEDADKWVQTIINHFGKIDLLINNGGFSQRSLVEDTPLQIDRKIFEVDYFAHIAITKAVLPHLIKQQSGNIIVISSIAGKFGFYYRSAYSAAKHALHGFFETLRLEVEKYNIQVLIVCPGKIKTNVSNNAILADGKQHQILDPSHADAMSAVECAKLIIKAIIKNKEEIFVGRSELLMVRIKRFFPNLFSFMIRRVKRE